MPRYRNIHTDETYRVAKRNPRLEAHPSYERLPDEVEDDDKTTDDDAEPLSAPYDRDGITYDDLRAEAKRRGLDVAGNAATATFVAALVEDDKTSGD